MGQSVRLLLENKGKIFHGEVFPGRAAFAAILGFVG